MPASTPSSRVQILRSLIQLLVDASEVVIKEWESEGPYSDLDGARTASPSLPSRELFEARRVIRGACEMCIDLVEDPRYRLQELAETFALSQAFDTTLRAGVPDILAEAEPRGGASASELNQRTGIDEKKLVQVMRLLCSVCVYDEVEELRFTNTGLSRVMAGNPGGKAFQCLFGTKLFVEAIEYLPATLLDPEMTSSVSANEAVLQKSQGTKQTLWDYIEEGDESDDKVAEARDVFPRSMIAQNQMSSSGLVADFPWGSLGAATIVDVGGGVDLPVTIEKAKSIWNADGVSAAQARRVRLMPHDLFKEQRVKDAEVYFLQCILHDWPDDACVTILSRLRDVMRPHSKVLIADMIVHPPLGSRHLASAPAPLPANYGRASAFKGMRDMVMLSMFNGSERTPEQVKTIANRAGLDIVKIWECRGPFSITELRLLA